jgi:hypothetical protein
MEPRSRNSSGPVEAMPKHKQAPLIDCFAINCRATGTHDCTDEICANSSTKRLQCRCHPHRTLARKAVFFQLCCRSAGFCAPHSGKTPNPSANWIVSIQPQTFYVCLKSKKDTPCLNPKSLRQSAQVQTLSRSPLGIKRSTTLLDGMVRGQPRQARSHITNQHKPASCNL